MLKPNFIYYTKWHFKNGEWTPVEIVKRLAYVDMELQDGWRLYPIGIKPTNKKDKNTNWI